jgi:hypothetical protein
MKKWKKIALIVLIVGILAAVGLVYWAKLPPPTASDSKPVVVYPAAELVKKISENRSSFDSAYMKKNIGVDGKIKSIDKSKFNLILEGNESAEIICTFDSSLFVKTLVNMEAGKEIRIKGIYSGNQGFEKSEQSGEIDLLDEVLQNNKTINLRTCAINQ